MKLKNLIYKISNGYTLLPFFLGLSISNECNRKCKFCLYQSPDLKGSSLLTWLKKQPKYMDINKFEKAIKRFWILMYFIKHVGLTAKGEPMKHPYFFRFCNILEKYKIKFSITTNGDYIGAYEIFRFNNYKYLQFVRVSVYEIKTYERLKHHAIFRFYNMTGKNIENTENGIKLWAEGLKTNTIKKDFNNIKSCKKPFSYLTLNPDYSVTLCNSWYEIGNILKTRLFWLWNNKKARVYRKLALKMKNIPDSDCLNCGFNL